MQYFSNWKHQLEQKIYEMLKTITGINRSMESLFCIVVRLLSKYFFIRNRNKDRSESFIKTFEQVRCLLETSPLLSFTVATELIFIHEMAKFPKLFLCPNNICQLQVFQRIILDQKIFRQFRKTPF